MAFGINGFQAVIWNMDGTLADTRELHYQTWCAAGREVGLPVSRELFLRANGENGLHAGRLMAAGTPVDVEALVARKEILFREMAGGFVRILPGVQIWLERFARHGLRQAIASSGSRENMDAVVRAMRIRSYFSTLVSGEGCGRKPAPAAFLMTARKLNVPPEACLVIEDTPAGVEAAHRAGMKCIAAATTNPEETLRGADILVPSLSGLTEDHFRYLG